MAWAAAHQAPNMCAWTRSASCRRGSSQAANASDGVHWRSGPSPQTAKASASNPWSRASPRPAGDASPATHRDSMPCSRSAAERRRAPSWAPPGSSLAITRSTCIAPERYARPEGEGAVRDGRGTFRMVAAAPVRDPGHTPGAPTRRRRSPMADEPRDPETPQDPPTGPTEPLTPPPRRLTRSSEDRLIGGVAGGLGRYFGIDPIIVRIAFVVLCFFGGVGVLAYIGLLAFVPADGPAGPQQNRLLAI